MIRVLVVLTHKMWDKNQAGFNKYTFQIGRVKIVLGILGFDSISAISIDQKNILRFGFNSIHKKVRFLLYHELSKYFEGIFRFF